MRKGGTVRAWLELLRLRYQADNLLAYFAASALAVSTLGGPLEWGWFLLGVVDLILAQVALELLDGYHDHRQGAHTRKDGAPTWTGGSGVLAEGRVRPVHALFAAWLMGALAVLVFAVLVAGRTGAGGLAIGAIGCMVGAGWAMPPFKLSYRGLGEILIGVVAGPLMTAHAWVVATGKLEPRAFLIGVPFGLLQLAMALAHGIVDRDADARVGKRTLVVRIGRPMAASAHSVTVVLAFASIAVLVALGIAPLSALAVVILVPLARQSARLVRDAASSAAARATLARSYPPYKLLILTGSILTLACLWRTG